jgi:uncharacterized protein (DUF433 family)
MTTETKTEHPHIVMTPGVCGGRARIAGSRIAVDFVARYLQSGIDAKELLEMYPHLKPAAVHDAISYYYDHQADVDRFNAENTMEALAKRYNFEIGDNGLLVFKDN